MDAIAVVLLLFIAPALIVVVLGGFGPAVVYWRVAHATWRQAAGVWGRAGAISLGTWVLTLAIVVLGLSLSANPREQPFEPLAALVALILLAAGASLHLWLLARVTRVDGERPLFFGVSLATWLCATAAATAWLLVVYCIAAKAAIG